MVVVPPIKIIVAVPLKAHDDFRVYLFQMTNAFELFSAGFVANKNLSMADSEAIFHVFWREQRRAGYNHHA